LDPSQSLQAKIGKSSNVKIQVTSGTKVVAMGINPLFEWVTKIRKSTDRGLTVAMLALITVG
jgi:hypothetical protein